MPNMISRNNLYIIIAYVAISIAITYIIYYQIDKRRRVHYNISTTKENIRYVFRAIEYQFISNSNHDFHSDKIFEYIKQYRDHNPEYANDSDYKFTHDAWGNKFLFMVVCEARQPTIIVISAGPDLEYYTHDDIADAYPSMPSVYNLTVPYGGLSKCP
jgi:hypothetical protein